MKAKLLPLLLALPLFAGCYVGDGAYVREEPPMAPAVVVDARPGYVWIDGRYNWDGYRYLWADGYWEAERPGFVYVQGGWVHGPRGYVYRQGYWNRGSGGQVWNAAQTRNGVTTYRNAPTYNGNGGRTVVVPSQGRPVNTRPAPARGGGHVTVHDHTK